MYYSGLEQVEFLELFPGCGAVRTRPVVIVFEVTLLLSSFHLFEHFFDATQLLA